MSSYGPFASGMAVRGMPVLNTYGASVFWVDSNGGGGSRGTFSHPCKTLEEAYDLCTADKGDIVMIKPKHAEDIIATVALDTSGVSIIGLGNGSTRPKITQITTGSDNGFEVTAAGQYMENIWFYDAAVAGTPPEVFFDIQAAGDDFTLVNCRLEMRTQVTEAITMAAGADDVTFDGCEFMGTSIGPDAAITVEGAVARLKVLNCSFNYYGSAGCDLGNIVFEASKNDEILIKGCHTFGLMEDEEFVQCLVGSSSSTSGMIVDCFGRVEDIGVVVIQSNAFTVINSLFAESGCYVGPGITNLNADDNSFMPALTSIS